MIKVSDLINELKLKQSIKSESHLFFCIENFLSQDEVIWYDALKNFSLGFDRLVIIHQWHLPNIFPWNCSILWDRIDAIPFQCFLSYPSFYQYYLYFTHTLTSTSHSSLLQLLSSKVNCSTCNDLMKLFSITQTASTTKNTYEKFLYQFGSNLVKNIYTSSCHPCPNTSISKYMELSKIYPHRYIRPST